MENFMEINGTQVTMNQLVGFISKQRKRYSELTEQEEMELSGLRMLSMSNYGSLGNEKPFTGGLKRVIDSPTK